MECCKFLQIASLSDMNLIVHEQNAPQEQAETEGSSTITLARKPEFVASGSH